MTPRGGSVRIPALVEHPNDEDSDYDREPPYHQHDPINHGGDDNDKQVPADPEPLQNLEEVRVEPPPPLQQGAQLDQNDNDDTDDDEVELAMVVAPLDPIRMTLTGQECDWASDIKEAIERTPELDHVSDFMCVQLALVVHEDVQGALDRAIQLQAFREEYDIKDTLEEGILLMGKLVDLFPRQYLDFGLHEDGDYVMIHDVVQFDGALLKTRDKMRTYLASQYYMNHAFYPDIEAMRRGTTILVECEGLSYTKKENFKPLNKMFSELLTAYPISGRCKQFHTSGFYNIMVSILKKVLPKSCEVPFECGCKFDGGRLDKFYLLPTVESANQRVLESFSDALKLRYKEERAFSLLPYDF